MSRRKKRKLIRRLIRILLISVVILGIVVLFAVVKFSKTSINEIRDAFVETDTLSEDDSDSMNNPVDNVVNVEINAEVKEKTKELLAPLEYSQFPYASTLSSPQEVFANKNYANHQTTAQIAKKYDNPGGMTDEEWRVVNPLAIPIGEYNSGKKEAKGTYAQWYNRKVAWYGDSVTELYYHCKVVNDYFEFDDYNCGMSGANVTEYDNKTLCQLDRLTNEITGIPQDVEVIFIMGGTNDWCNNVPLGDSSVELDAYGVPIVNTKQFCGACHQMFYYMKMYYPNAKIIALGTPIVITNAGKYINDIGLTSMDYSRAMQKAADYWKIDFFDVVHNSGISNETANDQYGLMYEGIHLTKKGGEMVGKTLINYLLDLDY